MIRINNTEIGYEKPTYFIADIAANHDKDLFRAKELIELAFIAGANAVKFQHFQALTIVSDKGFKEIGNKIAHQSSWDKSVFEVYQEAELPPEWTEELYFFSKNLGIDFFTAPYSLQLIEQVEPFIPAFKIGSGDITWIESIVKMASYGKPLLIATGASTMVDVERAVEAALKINPQIILMQCNTNYTGTTKNFNYLNLNVLKTYSQKFPGVILGLSDHTPGHISVIAAVSMGARVVEKHFTDDNNRAGPDHKFSMNPETWKEMIVATRQLEASLGNGIKVIEQNEKESVIVQQRALRYSKSLQKGHKVNRFDLDVLRPCPTNSMKPFEIESILDKVLDIDVDFHQIVEREHFT
jgi:N-acetylneuraminate synthase